MDTKEQKAKEYAESLTGLDYMGEVEAERAYLSGWEAAMQHLYKLPLDLTIEEIINQNKNVLKRLKDR